MSCILGSRFFAYLSLCLGLLLLFSVVASADPEKHFYLLSQPIEQVASLNHPLTFQPQLKIPFTGLQFKSRPITIQKPWHLFHYAVAIGSSIVQDSLLYLATQNPYLFGEELTRHLVFTPPELIAASLANLKLRAFFKNGEELSRIAQIPHIKNVYVIEGSNTQFDGFIAAEQTRRSLVVVETDQPLEAGKTVEQFISAENERRANLAATPAASGRLARISEWAGEKRAALDRVIAPSIIGRTRFYQKMEKRRAENSIDPKPEPVGESRVGSAVFREISDPSKVKFSLTLHTTEEPAPTDVSWSPTLEEIMNGAPVPRDLQKSWTQQIAALDQEPESADEDLSLTQRALKKAASIKKNVKNKVAAAKRDKRIKVNLTLLSSPETGLDEAEMGVFLQGSSVKKLLRIGLTRRIFPLIFGPMPDAFPPRSELKSIGDYIDALTMPAPSVIKAKGVPVVDAKRFSRICFIKRLQAAFYYMSRVVGWHYVRFGS